MARDSLAGLALNRGATCLPTGESYDRVVAWCSVPAAGRSFDLSCNR
jgi:hypothetical protein